MSVETELKAMTDVAAALRELDEEGTRRVLRWALDHYGVAAAASASSDTPQERSDSPQGRSDWSDIYEMFGSTDASSDVERALLAGYWFQTKEGHASFTGSQVNTSLKHMGVGAANIAQVLGRLIARRPALVQQISKSGRSQQARKQYRLTSAGVSAAEVILARAAGADS